MRIVISLLLTLPYIICSSDQLITTLDNRLTAIHNEGVQFSTIMSGVDIFCMFWTTILIITAFALLGSHDRESKVGGFTATEVFSSFSWFASLCGCIGDILILAPKYRGVLGVFLGSQHASTLFSRLMVILRVLTSVVLTFNVGIILASPIDDSPFATIIALSVIGVSMELLVAILGRIRSFKMFE